MDSSLRGYFIFSKELLIKENRKDFTKTKSIIEETIILIGIKIRLIYKNGFLFPKIPMDRTDSTIRISRIIVAINIFDNL